ncbi:LysR family transcriptional regulator [Parachitinimonas caeni]|uniref:LysR family transcriptional regulator n=1 Tax=Parachitinimonas caeni TaxID=3031301 RepID=A0ABT7DZX9_9NEIS|nr:LysR family transcriptional regulator [Parachitinimonas caeni]MDK2125379.1 LysR family transcriptional regulator [Parachitinimonas caeni]
MDIDTSLLRAFVMVVRHGSINRAASLLGRTQPALSQQMRKLEELLGQAVLVRSTRGISLTPSGETLLPYAERIVALADQVVPDMRGPAKAGNLLRKVGLIEDLIGARLPNVLADFAAVHPGLRLEVQVAPWRQMSQAFIEGELDVLVTDLAAAEDIPQPPVGMFACPLVWLGAMGQAWPDPLPLIMFAPPCTWRATILTALNRTQMPWQIMFESPSYQAVQAALQAGLGLTALLPDAVPRGVQRVVDERLPPLPPVSIGVFRQPTTMGDPITDELCRLFLREIGGIAAQTA